MIRACKSRRPRLVDEPLGQGHEIRSQPWARRFLPQWERLFDHCGDQGSRRRLAGLRERFDTRKWPMAHSAIGEVDVACLLVRAGFSLAFLEETDVRTADLECYWEQDRCFVEVTVMAPSHVRSSHVAKTGDPGLSLGDSQAALEYRLMARMVEKARQLDRYCAPIVLAVTVPSWPPQLLQGPERHERIDVQRLGGVSVSALAGLPQLSMLLLTFWEAEPQERRSTVRLADVACMTRTASDFWQPRIRMLVNNPFARYAVGKKERIALQRAL